MKHRQNWRLFLCALALLALGGVHAQDSSVPPPSAPAKFSPAELEKLAAPIALHPDPLIAIILPASVYPLEVVKAARFVKDTNNVSKVDAQPWDENVKAVAKFPELVAKMDADLAWTTDLGQAFVEQQKELMDVIQTLRAKANTAGVLKTTPQQVIVVTNSVIEKTVEQQVVFVTNTVVQIQPSNPQVVYVPSYPPTIYYPSPVYVGPPPLVTFAAGIAVGAIIANNCDWFGGGIYHGHGHGDVDIDIDNSVNIGNNNQVNHNKVKNTKAQGGQKWQPDQSRMASSGAPSAKASTKAAQNRGWSPSASQTGPTGRGPSAGTQPSLNPAVGSQRPANSAASRPPSASTSDRRPASSPSASTRPASSPSAGNRPAASPSQSMSRQSPSAPRDSAFGGAGNGAATREASNRGSSSLGGGGGGGGRPAAASRSSGGGGGSRSGGGGGRSGGGGGRSGGGGGGGRGR